MPTVSEYSGIPESQERNRQETYVLIQHITCCKYIRLEIKKREHQNTKQIVCLHIELFDTCNGLVTMSDCKHVKYYLKVECFKKMQ